MKRAFKATFAFCLFLFAFSLLCLTALGATVTVVDDTLDLGEAELSVLQGMETTYPLYLYLPAVSRYDDYRDVERYTEQMMAKRGI